MLSVFNSVNVKLRTTVCSAQCTYENNLVNLLPARPNLFHSYLRNIKVDRPKTGHLAFNDNLIDDPLIMANIFVNSFTSVYDMLPLLTPILTRHVQPSSTPLRLLQKL